MRSLIHFRPCASMSPASRHAQTGSERGRPPVVRARRPARRLNTWRATLRVIRSPAKLQLAPHPHVHDPGLLEGAGLHGEARVLVEAPRADLRGEARAL